MSNGENENCYCRECGRQLVSHDERQFGTCDSCCASFRTQFNAQKEQDKEGHRLAGELMT